MSNKSLVKTFGGGNPFSDVVNKIDFGDKSYAHVKTFFTKYRNPVGIEVEVEGMDKPLQWKHKVPLFWRVDSDGSLRDHGLEFISSPLSGKMIDYAIEELADCFTHATPRWSVRTSIHVHVNMDTYTFNQLKAFCMVYGLFEDCFFNMAEPHRKANAYSYPATSISPETFCTITDNSKYCALNLAPLRRQTTVEFRHLQGTSDWRHIRRWIQLIVKLHYFCEKLKSNTAVEEVTKIIGEQRHLQLFKDVFGASTLLFSETEINDSARKNACWALALTEWSML